MPRSKSRVRIPFPAPTFARLACERATVGEPSFARRLSTEAAKQRRWTKAADTASVWKPTSFAGRVRSAGLQACDQRGPIGPACHFEAPSPRGKAEVCKTSTPGSNPGGASNFHSHIFKWPRAPSSENWAYFSQTLTKSSPGAESVRCEPTIRTFTLRPRFAHTRRKGMSETRCAG